MASSSGDSPDYVAQNILITGAAGFIGSAVARRLLQGDYHIVVLDKLTYCGRRDNLPLVHPRLEFVHGDVCNRELVDYLLRTKRIDTIMHFAASTHVDNSFASNSTDFTTNNVVGTHVLLEASRTVPTLRRFIHVSTDEVYGGNETEHDFFEGGRLNPTNPYAATKAAAEMLCTSYRHSYGLPIIVTRGNNVYGPRQYPEKLVPKFTVRGLYGLTLPIHGSGSQRRSYLYVDDVAEAFEFVLRRGRVGEVYNIGTREERTVAEVTRDICAELGLDPGFVVQHVADRPFNDPRYFMNMDKIHALGWRPTTPWQEGLRRTIAWYRAHLTEYPVAGPRLATPTAPNSPDEPAPALPSPEL